MKKLIAILTALTLCLPLCACSERTDAIEHTTANSESADAINLTTANIDKYLSIDADVVDSNVEKETTSILGIGIYSYEGKATVKLNVVNQSGATFKNVTIKCRLSTFMNYSSTIEGHDYGWEFKTGNRQSILGNHDSKNYKDITITLPYDGNWSTTEELELVLYTETSKVFLTPYKLSSCYLTISSVSGTVEE